MPDLIAERLTLLHATSVDNEVETYEEFLEVNFGSDGGEELNEVFGDELDNYATLGFDDYVNDKESNDLISEDLADYLKDFYGHLSDWIETNEPSALQLDTFLTHSSAEVDTMSQLCPFEKYQAQLYHKSILGFYRFIENGIETGSLTNVQVRDCDWWQAIICGAGGLVVGAISWAAGTAIIIGADEVLANGRPIPPGPDRDNVALSVGLAVGIYSGISFYNWCCRLFDKGECEEPLDKIFVIATDCNEYVLSFASNSGGESYYIWNNGNMIPAVETTYVRNLVVEADNPSMVSTTTVLVRCVDSNGPSNFTVGTQSIFLSDFSNSPPPNPTWLWAPPATAALNSTHNLVVLAAPYEYFELEWGATYGASFTPTGPFSAEVTFTSTGSIGIKAKVTNTCTDEYAQLSAFVNVTN